MKTIAQRFTEKKAQTRPPKSAASFCEKFNLTFSKSCIRLVAEGDNNTFQVVLSVDDPFLDRAQYQGGNAYIYLSGYFYKTIEEEAIKEGLELGWNNTKTTGWLTQA